MPERPESRRIWREVAVAGEVGRREEERGGDTEDGGKCRDDDGAEGVGERGDEGGGGKTDDVCKT